MVRILSGLVLFFPTELLAATLEENDLIFSGLKMFIGMIVVVGLMLLVYVLHRKGIGILKAGKANRINIVEIRHLGGRKMLCLAEVNGQEFLLGLGNDRIDLLCRLTDKEAIADFKSEFRKQIEEER